MSGVLLLSRWCEVGVIIDKSNFVSYVHEGFGNYCLKANYNFILISEEFSMSEACRPENDTANRRSYKSSIEER